MEINACEWPATRIDISPLKLFAHNRCVNKLGSKAPKRLQELVSIQLMESCFSLYNFWFFSLAKLFWINTITTKILWNRHSGQLAREKVECVQLNKDYEKKQAAFYKFDIKKNTVFFTCRDYNSMEYIEIYLIKFQVLEWNISATKILYCFNTILL